MMTSTHNNLRIILTINMQTSFGTGRLRICSIVQVAMILAPIEFKICHNGQSCNSTSGIGICYCKCIVNNVIWIVEALRLSILVGSDPSRLCTSFVCATE